ncbi:MAG: hypothetical protein H7840_15160 [Alphaproteobacteria bacterium]
MPPPQDARPAEKPAPQPTDDRWTSELIPVFDVGLQAFNTWYCRPRLTKADGSVVVDDVLLAEGMGERAVNEKTLAGNMMQTITVAATHARRLAHQDGDATLIVPINGAALTYKDIAGTFSSACRQLEADIRRMLVFEVTNVADTVRMSYLDDIAIILHLFCKAYIGRVTPKSQDFKIFATCNYAGVSLPLMDKPWPADKVGPYLSAFVTRAQKSRLSAYVHGVGSPAIAEAATTAGAHFIDGVAVRPR